LGRAGSKIQPPEVTQSGKKKKRQEGRSGSRFRGGTTKHGVCWGEGGKGGHRWGTEAAEGKGIVEDIQASEKKNVLYDFRKGAQRVRPEMRDLLRRIFHKKYMERHLGGGKKK